MRSLGIVPESSGLTEWFVKLFDEFESNWKMYSGLDDRPRSDLIMSELYGNAQVELRALADVNINEELNELKIAHIQDSGKTINLSADENHYYILTN